MRSRTILYSVGLHALVIGATMVTWPHALDMPGEPPPAIPVELVDISEVTNIAAQSTAPSETPPPEDATPAPEVQEAPAPPQPKEAEPAPEPEPKLAEKKPEPAPAPPKPQVKPKPEPKKKEDKFDVNSILALLDQQKTKTAPAANATKSDRNVSGIGAQTGLSMSLIDALKAQMYRCWNFPAGAPNPEKLIVTVHVSLSPDGNLLAATSRMVTDSDPYMRAAGAAAVRAVNVCAPYKLPAEQYSQWREIDMIFDPSKMVGMR